jgi:hypothetical protein
MFSFLNPVGIATSIWNYFYPQINCGNLDFVCKITEGQLNNLQVVKAALLVGATGVCCYKFYKSGALQYLSDLVKIDHIASIESTVKDKFDAETSETILEVIRGIIADLLKSPQKLSEQDAAWMINKNAYRVFNENYIQIIDAVKTLTKAREDYGPTEGSDATETDLRQANRKVEKAEKGLRTLLAEVLLKEEKRKCQHHKHNFAFRF